ncbi:MAG: hypothetical protein ACI4XG_09385, partial [Bradyrhizobium sp.]
PNRNETRSWRQPFPRARSYFYRKGSRLGDCHAACGTRGRQISHRALPAWLAATARQNLENNPMQRRRRLRAFTTAT